MYKQNLFSAIKLMFIAVIFVEMSTLKMIIMPKSFLEFVHITALFGVYIEHIVFSILILGLGALIFLKQT